MKKAILWATLAAPLMALFFISVHVSIILFKPNTQTTPYFTIAPGEGFSSINYRLAKEGIIDNARVFHYYAKFKNSLTRFKAGTYEIPKSASMATILTTLVDGKPMLIRVTIPEGKNMFEIGKILEAQNITSYEDFIIACRSEEMRAKIWSPHAPSVEGYLFPETYKFAPRTPARQVVQAMLTEFFKRTSNLDFKLTHLTPHEVVNLAAIVEKETGAKFERPTIAGVYLNRLKKKMRLQADPTTIYGIWENFDGNLRRIHLQEKTDYNTYRLPALPLGPIANPSLAAIQAVLTPEKHSYIYFVSKNDGTHIFSATYKEHLEAVNYWQRNVRNREGRSWRDLNQNQEKSN